MLQYNVKSTANPKLSATKSDKIHLNENSLTTDLVYLCTQWTQ